MKRINRLVLSGAVGVSLLAMSSCGVPKDIAYFQDFNLNPDTVVTLQSKVLTVKMVLWM